MPGIFRKLFIYAAVDGLILQPNGNGSRHNGSGSGSNSDSSSIRVEYKTSKITSFSGPGSAPEQNVEKKQADGVGLEVYGLVGGWLIAFKYWLASWLWDANLDASFGKGLLSVASYSYLISITQRQQVAQIQGNPIYAITNIALIPTSSRADALRAITQAKEHPSQPEPGPEDANLASSDGEDAADDDDGEDGNSLTDAETDGGETDISTVPDSDSQPAAHAPGEQEKEGESALPRGRSINSIAEDVFGKRVRFGRFAASWLSRKTLGLPGFGTVDRGTTDMLLRTNDEAAKEDPESHAAISGVSKEEGEGGEANAKEPVVPGEEEKQGAPSPEAGVEAKPQSSDQTVEELLPKLLRYTTLLFASRNFFFSYDYDLTRQIGGQEPRNGYRPLHRTVDPLVSFDSSARGQFYATKADRCSTFGINISLTPLSRLMPITTSYR